VLQVQALTRIATREKKKKPECQGESMNRGSVSIDFVCDSRAYSILSAALGSGYSPDYQEVKSPPGQKQS
jgi:hypothetical protein